MKKGISLIVLVITIIVIIILAGAVILSLSKSNPIQQSTKAVYLQDKDSVQSAINMFLAGEMATGRATADVQPGTLESTGGTATYTIGGGAPQHFVFGTGTGTVGISLPTYTANWTIDDNALVHLTVTMGSTPVEIY